MAESMARKKCLLFVFRPRNNLRLQPVEQIYHQCLASCRPPWPPNSPPCTCMHTRSSKTMQVGATQGTYTVSSGGPVLNTITAVPASTRVWQSPRNGSGLVTSGRGGPLKTKKPRPPCFWRFFARSLKLSCLFWPSSRGHSGLLLNPCQNPACAPE